MYQSDWILRQIELVATALGRLISALREQRPDEAMNHAEEAIGTLLGGESSLVDVLSGEGIVSLLSAAESLDMHRAIALAEVLARRADAQEMSGRSGDAYLDRERAQALLLAALDVAEDEDGAHIRGMLDDLEVGPGADT